MDKENLYVRYQDKNYEHYALSKITQGRYFKVEDKTKFLDITGSVVLYGFDYLIKTSKLYTYELSNVEIENIDKIFNNKEKYRDFFNIGKSITLFISNIEAVCSDLDIFIDIFKIKDVDDFSKVFYEQLKSKNNSQDYESEIKDLLLMFESLEYLLYKLNQLEDRYIRNNLSVKNENSYDEKLVKILNIENSNKTKFNIDKKSLIEIGEFTIKKHYGIELKLLVDLNKVTESINLLPLRVSLTKEESQMLIENGLKINECPKLFTQSILDLAFGKGNSNILFNFEDDKIINNYNNQDKIPFTIDLETHISILNNYSFLKIKIEG